MRTGTRPPASSFSVKDDDPEAFPRADEAKEVVQLVCARVGSDDEDLQPPAALDGR